MYYLKKLGHQELGSIKPGGKPSRGRYIYISKDDRVLSFFPPLSRYVKNDSSLLPVIPLYAPDPEKVYCNFIYHNDKYNGSTSLKPRNEYRIYLNNSLELDRLYFETDDILILRKSVITVESDESSEEKAEQTVYFADRVSPADGEFYQQCSRIIEQSAIRGEHAVHDTALPETEVKIQQLRQSQEPLRTVVDQSVTRNIESSGTQVADLFNSTSFRDFTMTAYQNKCAVTGTVIQYGKFLNLEAAHIRPKSHGGLFLPSNGMALSRDVHWSFDKGFFTLNDDCTIMVHEKVESDFLKTYHGKTIHVPDIDFFKPDIESIRYHRENVYGLFLTSGRL